MYTKKELRERIDKLTIANIIVDGSPIPKEFKQRLKEIGEHFNMLNMPINQFDGKLPKKYRLEIRQWLWIFVRKGGLQLLNKPN